MADTADQLQSNEPLAQALGVRHVAIVMDGNGRWAKARGLERTQGHRQGVEAARRCLEAARELGLKHLTLYSFSTENWRRPAGEVRDLMALLKEFIIDDLPTLKKNNICVRILGDRKNLSPDIALLVDRVEKETRKNDQFFLHIAFNYGGRDELVRAAKAFAKDVQGKKRKVEELNEELFDSYLDTKDLPEPDLVIRTSGEKRVSNFLIWQAAYAEYVFIDTLWPDFNIDVFAQALREYAGRERRFGGVGIVGS